MTLAEELKDTSRKVKARKNAKVEKRRVAAIEPIREEIYKDRTVNYFFKQKTKPSFVKIVEIRCKRRAPLGLTTSTIGIPYSLKWSRKYPSIVAELLKQDALFQGFVIQPVRVYNEKGNYPAISITWSLT